MTLSSSIVKFFIQLFVLRPLVWVGSFGRGLVYSKFFFCDYASFFEMLLNGWIIKISNEKRIFQCIILRNFELLYIWWYSKVFLPLFIKNSVPHKFILKLFCYFRFICIGQYQIYNINKLNLLSNDLGLYFNWTNWRKLLFSIIIRIVYKF
jgi:hypothetical protein